MVYAFNTVYVAIIQNGKPLYPQPVVAVYDEETNTWINKQENITVEWLGEVATLWGDAGDERYFSSYDLSEVLEWLQNSA